MGVAETATEVKGDFILTPNVPAMAAPGDEFMVSIGVFNNTTGGTEPIQEEPSPARTVARGPVRRPGDSRKGRKASANFASRRTRCWAPHR